MAFPKRAGNPRIAAIVYLAIAALLCCAQAFAEPSLWTVHGAKGTLYLFGSAHMLPGGVDWHTPGLQQALAQAQSVAFEVDMGEAEKPESLRPLMGQLGFLEPGRSLQGMLRPPVWALLGRTAADLQMPLGQFTRMRPWLATMALAVNFAIKQGFDPERGVDKLLYREALAAGKSFEALESLESQLRVFADLSPQQQAQYLAFSLRQMRDSPQILQEVAAAYGAGDQQSLYRLFSDGDDELPFMRQRLLLDRHAQWLPQIEAMLAEDRTRLIVVGAAHLAGPDSIVAMLRAKGIRVDGP